MISVRLPVSSSRSKNSCIALAAAGLILGAVFLMHGDIAAAGAPEAPVESPENPDSNVIPEIPEGRYRYRFTWNGIPGAEAEVAIARKRDVEELMYVIVGAARTSAFVDIFWKFRAKATAIADGVTGRAKTIFVSEQERSKFEKTRTVFDYEASVAHYTRWRKSRVKNKEISLAGGTIDPVCLGMSVAGKNALVGYSAEHTVLVGDDSYALEYEVTAVERVSAAGEDVEALRIEPRFHKIQPDREKPPKVREMTIWVTESTPHLPLRMRSKTFIGYVYAELVQVLPPGSEEGTELDPLASSTDWEHESVPLE